MDAHADSRCWHGGASLKSKKGLHARAYNPFFSYWCADRNRTAEGDFRHFLKSTAKDTATSSSAPRLEFSDSANGESLANAAVRLRMKFLKWWDCSHPHAVERGPMQIMGVAVVTRLRTGRQARLRYPAKQAVIARHRGLNFTPQNLGIIRSRSAPSGAHGKDKVLAWIGPPAHRGSGPLQSPALHSARAAGTTSSGIAGGQHHARTANAGASESP